MRVEALEELADWPHPSGRDRVVGLWRPVAAVRPRETAVEALQPALAGILRATPDSVQVAATRAVGRLNIADAAPLLSGLVGATELSGRVRVEALKALAALDDTKLEDAVQVAQADANEELRRAATQLQAKVKSSNAAARLAVTLANGTLGDKQAALAALGALPDPAADELLGRWLDRLQAGGGAEELQLDFLAAAAKRSAAAGEQKMSGYEAVTPEDEPPGG